MMRALSPLKLLFVTSLFGAVVGACTLNAEGLNAGEEPSAPGPPDASGGTQDPPDPPIVECPDTLAECADAVPEGWERVGYADNRDTECPKGLTALDVETDASALPGACTCEGCTITEQPDCYTDQIPTGIDQSSSPQCDQPGVTVKPQNQGACSPIAATLPRHASAMPPKPEGGSCTLAPTPHADKITARGARACVPSSKSCEAELCAEGGALAECIWIDGQTECPAGPFKNIHHVGTKAGIACGGCGCEVKGAACGGTLTFFSSSDCSGGSALTLPVNNTCVDTNQGTSLKSFTFQPSVMSAACSESAPPKTTTTLEAPKTICCK